MEKDLKVDFMRYTLSVLALILLASCVSIKETDVAYEERKGYILVVDDTLSQIEYKNGAFLLYSPSIGISGEVLSHSYSGKRHYFWSTKYGINIVMDEKYASINLNYSDILIGTKAMDIGESLVDVRDNS